MVREQSVYLPFTIYDLPVEQPFSDARNSSAEQDSSQTLFETLQIVSSGLRRCIDDSTRNRITSARIRSDALSSASPKALRICPNNSE